ncbi:hypothetical protein IGI04_033096 [Brassica rapa subsp. trilocularis]|uniref:non-specific serine/threonine protein kinase n=1 Tax=Brassica rapa subsp. trilocularis TaxID=1813537 RepID=A0ABQ7L7B4_BRACM|nr:hypothetical protein IGI04_033096 [Brassica rapa subsp. trilocularis]
MYHKLWVYRMVVKVWSIAEKLLCLQMSAIPPAAAIGGAVGALALSALLVFLLWFCIFRRKNASRTSESGSSDPSTQERRSVAMDLSMREARSFKMEELAQATKSFTNKSLIGTGKFGEVYKGLLQDGVLVAIKKRPGLPTQEFVNEVRYLSSINHRNLVTLLGYCQENNTQFLVYEYVPNGSVSSHLYGGGDKVSGNRLEFRNRLAISIGAAKGLAHLHSLSPRLIHKDFKTANVLVDENFIARVADAGVRNFLGRDDVVVGTSSLDAADQIFLSPEVQEFRRFSEKSDVYAFGVFLLELVSGREASEPSPSSSTQTRVEWMQNIRDYTDTPAMIDERLGGTYTAEGVEEVITLTLRCLNVSSEKRPAMSYVLTELERILDKEVSLTTVMGEGTPTVTLGIELAEDDNSSVSRTLGYYYLLCLDPNTQSYFSYKPFIAKETTTTKLSKDSNSKLLASQMRNLSPVWKRVVINGRSLVDQDAHSSSSNNGSKRPCNVKNTSNHQRAWHEKDETMPSASVDNQCTHLLGALCIKPTILPLSSPKLTLLPPQTISTTKPSRLSSLRFRPNSSSPSTSDPLTVDYNDSPLSVFPAEACEVISGYACSADIYPEVKLETKPVSPPVASEPVDREYLEYNNPKTVFPAEACDDLGGEFCEPDYQKDVY